MALHRLKALVVVVGVLLEGCHSWKHLPEIPAGRRAQYYLLKGDGGYKYGYDTGTGIYHKANSGPNHPSGGHSFSSGSSYKHHAQSQGAALASWSPTASGQQGWAGQAGEEQSSGDASYSFQYSTGDQSRREASDAQGNIQGNYAYTRPDGLQHSVEYEAGAGKGFVVKSGSSAATAANSFNSAQSGNAYVNNALTTSAVSNAPGLDGSYAFSYNVGDHSRSETSDAQGNVRGSYSFVAKDDGQTRTVNYEAGAEKGFIAEGEHLPKPDVPSTPSSYYSNYASNQNSGPSLTHYQGTSGQSQVGQSGYTVQTSYHPNQPNYAQSTGQSNINDGSYSFSYQAKDHSRSESADASGNVKGSFSFTPEDDGVQRTVTYEAGAEKGFVATGAHLPKSPSVASIGHSASHSWHASNAGNSGYTVPQTYHQGVVQGQSPPSSYNQQINPDGSYTFSYSADDHSRTESGDTSGNIQGTFSFVAKDDGQIRTVGYEAGANKGFIAQGDHIPKPVPAPVVQSTGFGPSAYNVAGSTGSLSSYHTPTSYSQIETTGHSSVSQPSPDGSYSFAYQTNDHSRQESQDASGNVKGSYSFVSKDDGVTRKVSYEAGADKGFIASGNHLPVPVSPASYSQQSHLHGLSQYSNSQQSIPGDSSYTFSYNTGDSSRTETSDSQGNLRGTFSYVSFPDGTTKTVNYEAGAEKGFIAEGAHLPNAQPNIPVTTFTTPFVSNSAAHIEETAHSKTESEGNRAYTYSYSSDSSSKHETSDEGGNVMGSYSYVDPNGVTRTINYSANDRDGFVIKDGAQGNAVHWSTVQQPQPYSDSAFHHSTRKSSHRNKPQSYLTPEGGKVYTYLYPNRRNKFGYIYDTKA